MPKLKLPQFAFCTLPLLVSLVVAGLPAALADQSSMADQEVESHDANSPANRDVGGQSLSGSNGDMFMEEVSSDKPKPKPKPIPIDLSRVGVSVDPHGNIVPMKDDANDQWAASGVKPFYNHIESTTTLPYVYPNPYGGGLPGVYPGYDAYPNYGAGYRAPGLIPSLLGAALFGNPALGGYRPYYPPVYSPAYLPNGNFGNGNPLYPGYSPWGLSTGYVTTGNSATFLSNDPTTGAPLPQGPQGNSRSNFINSAGTFSPLPWLAPTTSYSQSSMWKAFNLGF